MRRRKPAPGKSPRKLDTRVLEALKRTVNTFIIGDLVIDHTVFVHDKPQSYPVQVSGELAFRVNRRLDTAGGAATTARTINSLGDGNTFLWGLVGSSPWGSFRSVLENSQAVDGAKNRIEFRGVQDETDAAMTTISRLVAVHNTGTGKERYVRKARFADDGHIHIPIIRQISALQHHLNRIHRAKAPLDCIVLNDLDMGALHRDVIKEIALIAATNEIPLVVRARRDASKYLDVKIRMLVCTLAEWVLLTDSNEDIQYWDQNISKSDVAEEFTRRSLGTFRDSGFFVILVGDDWIDKIIIIQRPSKTSEPCHLSIAPGLSIEEKARSQQVGASDVFTGALAFAIAGMAPDHEDFSNAINIARLVTQAYQRTGWHHVPHFDVLLDEVLEPKGGQGKVTEKTFGTPFLPRGDVIDMTEAVTCIPGVYSVTTSTKEALASILHHVKNDSKSLVLVASGGSGKSAVSKEVLNSATGIGLNACNFEDLDVAWSWSEPDKTVDAINQACRSKSPLSVPFVIVDEALKLKDSQNISSTGVLLLNKAQEKGVRFLLVDADFAKIDLKTLRSQFGRRVSWHALPSAWDHPKDISYVLAACLYNAASPRRIQFSIDASALDSIIEWMLREKQSYGHLFEVAKGVVVKHKGTGPFTLRWKDLPTNIRGKYEPHRDPRGKIYTIKFE